MKLIMENWKRFLRESAMSGPGPLAEPAYRVDEYPEDEAPDEDDDGALRPRERDRLRSDVFKLIPTAIPDEEVEVDLDEGAGRLPRLSDVDGDYFLSQMSPKARGALLKSVSLATVYGQGPQQRLQISNDPDKNEEGLEFVINRLDPAAEKELKEISEKESLDARSIILVLLSNENELSRAMREFDLGEVDPDAHEL